MDRQRRTALTRLAESQRGLFSAAQAAQLGISPGQLWRYTESGYFRRSRFGVYAISGSSRSRWEDIVAAALAAGRGAVVSHSSAAAVHRLYCPPPGAPEITLRHESRLRIAGVIAHRCLSLPDCDLVMKYGVAITSPARTVLDMADRLTPAFLERMMDEGLVARQWSVTDLAACLDRAAANAPGRRRVERLVNMRNEAPVADSLLEVRVYRALEPLAPFHAHFVMSTGGSSFVLDAAWPERRIGAEIIGREHRVASRSAFDRERRKLNVLAAAGWQIVHLTSAMSDEEIRSSLLALLGDSLPAR